MIKNKMLRLRFFIMLILSFIMSPVMMFERRILTSKQMCRNAVPWSAYLSSNSYAMLRYHFAYASLRNSPNKISIESYATYKKTNGIDQRPPVNTTLLLAECGNIDAINKYLPNRNPGDINKIRWFFVKKELLNILENPDISSHIKIGILTEFEDYPRPPNISAGGLMSDFDFEF